MATIQKGQVVSFLCSSYLSNGECLESGDNEPIRMVAGSLNKGNDFSKSVSKSLIGMSINEIKQLKLPAKFAFGEKDENKIFKMPITGNSTYKIGDDIQIKVTDDEQAQVLEGTITKIRGDYAYVDTNHPLAGEILTVKIKIISFD